MVGSRVSKFLYYINQLNKRIPTVPISMGYVCTYFEFLRISWITSSRISSFWVFSELHGPIFEIFVSYESAQQEDSNGTHINTLLWRKYTLSVIFQKSNMFDNSMIRGNFLTKLSCGYVTCDADSNTKKIFWKFSKFRSICPFCSFFAFLHFSHAYDYAHAPKFGL